MGDPLNKVRRVLVLNSEHLIVHFLCRHLSSEHSRSSEVSSLSGVASSHHVLYIEHLGDKLGNSDSSVFSALSGGKGSESNQEEVETGEGNKVDSQLSEVRIELSRESKATRNSTHNGIRDDLSRHR